VCSFVTSLVVQVVVIDVAVPIGRPDRRVGACLVSGDAVRTRWQFVTSCPGPAGAVTPLAVPHPYPVADPLGRSGRDEVAVGLTGTRAHP
jgi:hypothetical protein